MPDKGESDVFSNPLPPSAHHVDSGHDAADAHPLTNADFRKLMMTPRAPPVTPGGGSGAKPDFKSPASDTPAGEDDPATQRKKKKSYYAKLKKMEEEREKELAEKYRDRAAERRDGGNTDYPDTEVVSTTADYRAVAPDAKAGENYAERRKQVIQESKYLGGDMEHTHLVKGLDYALLDKVRAEISSAENIQEQEMEAMAVTENKNEKKEEDPEVTILFKTKLARNVFRTVFKTQLPERNELFLPRRMAYVVDLEDEYAESDIPTTLIRSKADCPSLEATTTLTTNDIVINKLTQILSYLRQGRRDAKKMKKKDKGRLKEDDRPKLTEESIYGDIGDYNPSYAKSKGEKDKRERERRDRDKDRDRGRDRERGRDRRERDRDRDREDREDRDRDREHEEKKRSYFEKPAEEDEEPENRPENAKEMVKNINAKFAKGWAPADLEREASLRGPAEEAGGPPTEPPKEDERVKKIKQKAVVDSYAECYPGMMESADAIDDSDDEVDYTKMDQGNKKGPIGRWDFDTQEEYSDYMSSKEALPKAAFQYGVKMADGRKTRRTGPKDEKKELDREWQKIQNIISKRKGGPGGEPQTKTAKY